MSRLSLFIWVQHLFGKGHVRRMARIAQACAKQGLRVTVVAGGPNGRKAFRGQDTISVHQLPALRTADHQYTGLLTDQDKAPDEIFWQMRKEAALDVLAVAQPDIVMTELFPFGRRMFAPEVLILLEAARGLPTRPLIVSSVRDVVEPKLDLEKTAQMEGWLKNGFDAVLVHGDPDIIALGETAPYVANAGVPLYYTGYVAPTIDDGPTAQAAHAKTQKAGVVVSAGSGLSGGSLLKVAAEAAATAASAKSPWHIFVPPGVEAPSSGKNPHVFVHPFGSTFADHLAQAEVSVSEAGYNTTAEALALGAKPVLVPYGDAGQTEQTFRASKFAGKGLVICQEPETLNPLRLIAQVGAAKGLEGPPALNLAGTTNTAFILNDLREGGLAS